MNYFLSKDVKVFPCSYRGSYPLGFSAREDAEANANDVPSVNRFFDPESRLMTEYNYTHLPGIVAGKKSYIISNDGGLLCVVIEGYYFEVTLPAGWSTTLPNNFKLHIRTIEQILTDGDLDSRRTTKYLASFVDNLTTLDQVLVGDAESSFTGLCYTTNDESIATAMFSPMFSLVITDANGNINHDNFLPELVQVYVGVNSNGEKVTNAIRFDHNNSASAENAVAFGEATEASGKNSLTSGKTTKASAENAVAFGEGTVANQPNQTVVGKYNALDSDALFIVGSGTSSTEPSNAFSVADGETKVKTKLTVADKSMTADGYTGKAQYANAINCNPSPAMTDALNDDNFKTIRQALLDMVYPIGSIYMSVNNESPGTFLGGIWETWGAGSVPVGVGTSDFPSAELTGGAKTKQLTTAELPAHTHDAVFVGSKSSTDAVGNHNHYFSNTRTTDIGGSHSHEVKLRTQAASGTSVYGVSAPDGYQNQANRTLGETSSVGGHVHSFSVYGYTQDSGSHNHTFTASGSVSIVSKGSGNSFSIMQPYITCYMWKRTG